jgi:hypothetical protein
MSEERNQGKTNRRMDTPKVGGMTAQKLAVKRFERINQTAIPRTSSQALGIKSTSPKKAAGRMHNFRHHGWNERSPVTPALAVRTKW